MKIPGLPFELTYDATVTDKRRRAPVSDVKSADDHLSSTERRKIVSTARDLRQNYALTAWAIRKHLDYIATFSFQSKTGIVAFDRYFEKFVTQWGKPKNFDVAGRHGLKRFIRILEASRVVDGDVFIHLMNSGMLQGIESDRIATVRGAMSAYYNIKDFKHGVKCSKGGRAQAYIVCNRSASGGQLIFDRVVPAKWMVQFAYWDRIDQTRGISPLAPVINTLKDTNEGIGYALARAKVAQLFALVLKRESAEAPGEVDSGAATDASDNVIDFGKGPIVLDLDPGDEASFLDSNQPAQEFQSFMNIMFSLCLKALDIPYSFYDESFTNYSGSRQALLLYEQSANSKRDDVKELLDTLLTWRMAIWILNGELQLPTGLTLDDKFWEWQASGLPWIDPMKETKADTESIANCTNSRQRIARRMGNDWQEVKDELAQEEKELQAAGIETARSSGDSQIVQYIEQDDSNRN